ncbi:TPA: LacI family transcriptional regulator, partial [Enterococcus faecalis]|nr:LacI family transcriptional regulator [Enterococcus faecalis]
MMNIKDIAKLAGVSASTVSKIINNKDQTISKETRERVLKIVRDYNYTPYSANLVTNSTTKTFVLLLNSHETFEAWVTSFIDKAQENGYNCLILNSHGSLEQELKNITSPTLKQASGIIWDPINENSKQYAKFIEELTIPYYFVNHSTNELPSLAGLYEEASYVLTQELLQNNHKK